MPSTTLYLPRGPMVVHEGDTISLSRRNEKGEDMSCAYRWNGAAWCPPIPLTDGGLLTSGPLRVTDWYPNSRFEPVDDTSVVIGLKGHMHFDSSSGANCDVDYDVGEGVRLPDGPGGTHVCHEWKGWRWEPPIALSDGSTLKGGSFILSRARPHEPWVLSDPNQPAAPRVPVVPTLRTPEHVEGWLKSIGVSWKITYEGFRADKGRERLRLVLYFTPPGQQRGIEFQTVLYYVLPAGKDPFHTLRWLPKTPDPTHWPMVYCNPAHKEQHLRRNKHVWQHLSRFFAVVEEHHPGALAQLAAIESPTKR